MNLVITGAESFIGKELKRHCLNRGISPLGIDVVPSSDERYCRCDVRDREIDQFIPVEADALIHLAALSTEKACRDDSATAFEVNVGGTINLIRAAQARGVKQFIFASSEWVYGDVGNADIQTENSPIDVARLESAYAITKIVGERLLWLAHKTGSLPVTVLRFGIVYGPRPSNWSAVEQLFHAVRTSDTVEVGSIRTARRFIHVSDIATGILSAVGIPGYQTFNLAGASLISLGEIIEESSAILGRKPKIIQRDPEKVSIRNPTSERAETHLHWRPRIGLSEGLRTLNNY